MGQHDLYGRIEEATVLEVAELARRDPEGAAWILSSCADENEAMVAAGSTLTFEHPRRDRAALAKEQHTLAAELRRIVAEREAA